MEKLVQRNPKEASAHFQRGSYLFDKAHREALKETLKSLELKPDNSDALLLAARCYLAARDVEKGRQYAARTLKLYPEDYNVYLNMVNIEMVTGHPDQAIAVVRQGLGVLRQNPALLWTLSESVDRSQSVEGGHGKRSRRCSRLTTPDRSSSTLNAHRNGAGTLAWRPAKA